MINNYKAQRNVRAELGGAVDLGEPVSLYIAEDEVKYGSKNLILNGSFTDNVDNWENQASRPWDTMIVSSGKLSAVVENGGGYASILSNKITFKKGSQYQIKYTATKTSGDNLKVNVHPNTSITDSSNGGSMYAEEISGTESNTAIFTATHTEGYVFLWVNAGSDSDAVATLDNVSVYEITDHTYKLMAVNDNIPANPVNEEAFGSDLFDSNRGTFTNGSNELRTGSEIASGALTNNVWYEISAQDGIDFTAHGAPDNNVGTVFMLSSSSPPTMDSNDKVYAITLSWTGSNSDCSASLDSNTLKIENAGTATTSPAHVDLDDGADLGSALVDGRTYIVEFEAKVPSGQNNKFKVVSGGTTTNGAGITSTTFVEDSIIFTCVDTATTNLYASGVGENETIWIDNITIKEVYGYDYYNAPAYKFGIVSSVYDQSTGAMKTTGAAGDQVEVTVQGECNAIGPSSTEVAGNIIRLINTNGAISDTGVGDAVLPNGVGVCVGNSSSTTKPIILFQGVEFSESFVHKNSLQVHAKCDEAITKFRPVSLFLDSNGDLLCKHDDIPEQSPDADTDHTGVDPGKWGIAELGGASGDLIPITVAGKTHVNTSGTETAGRIIKQIQEDGDIFDGSSANNDYIPNAIGTVMESGTGDVPITIFGGTPIGTITNWKRTIKVTAKANGAITQYCPVSLYLDQYGDYRCISDDIPDTTTNSQNGMWVDFRKWGIAQETVADGEFVEIIVQGRTNVVNSLSGANREDFILKISAAGGVTGGAPGVTKAYALSSLGIVEKEARTSDGTPGVIIIF